MLITSFIKCLDIVVYVVFLTKINNMKLKASIPIKSYLRKYILNRFKSELPLVISKNFMLGKLIIKIFSEHQNRTKKTSDYNDTIEIVFDHEYDLTLSAGNVFDFNSLIEDIYRKDLAMFIGFDKLFNKHPERKQAILNFNSLFGINEDDIELATLIKHIQRHKEDTQIIVYQKYKKVS